MVFQLSANGPLPSQKQVLSVSENKRQLIHIIVEALLAEAVVPGRCSSRLIITGQEPTPIEVAPRGVVVRREDIKATHEEADAIIVAQAIYAAKEENKHVVVVADDTDVYILLLYLSEALVAETVPETLTKEKQKLIITRVVVNRIIVRVWVVVYNPTEVKQLII